MKLYRKHEGMKDNAERIESLIIELEEKLQDRASFEISMNLLPKVNTILEKLSAYSEHTLPSYLTCDKCSKGDWISAYSEVIDQVARHNYDVRIPVNTGIQVVDALGKSVNMLMAELVDKSNEVNAAQKVAKIGHWNWNIITNELLWSDQIYSILEIQKGDLSVTYDTFLSFVHVDDREMVDAAVEKAIRYNIPYNIDHRMITHRGQLKYINEQGKVYHNDEGKAIRMVGTAQDITKRVLREQEFEKVHAAVEASANAVFICEPHGEVTFANQSAAHIWGFDSVAKMTNMYPNILDYWQEEEVSKMSEIIEKIAGEEKCENPIHLQVKRKDGDLFYAAPKVSAILGNKGRLIGLVCTFTDITNTIYTQQQLEREQRRLKSYFNTTSSGIIVMQQAVMVDVNQATASILGFNREELKGRSFLDFVHEDEVEKVRDLNARRANGEDVPSGYVVKVMSKKGGILYLKADFGGFVEFNDKPAMLGSFIDITTEVIQRDRLEERKKDIKKLSTVAEKTGFSVMIMSADSRVEWVNDSFVKTTGYQLDEIKGKHPLEFLTGPETSQSELERIGNLMEKGKEAKGEIVNYRKNGESFWYDYSIVPILNDEGIVISHISTRTEITQRKKLEEQLTINLEQKDVLLSELHHRVKNNLQIVNGLLDLQLTKISNEEVRSALSDTKNRIHAMAAVHDRLYQSTDISQINMKQYLSVLVDEVRVSFGQNNNIRCIADIDPIQMNMEQAIPLGLIITEIISNTCKYAFPNNALGVLKVVLKAYDNQYTLVVSDNGIGFDRQNLGVNTSIGLKLIEALSQQLDGTLEIISSYKKGAIYKLTIPTNAQ